MIRTLMLSLCTASIATGAASAQVMPSDLKWGPGPAGLPAGAQVAVLSGDPGKEGMFTIRLKFPAGYAVAAHHHPTPELVTVIEGSAAMGMGDKLDKSKAKTLGVGGFVELPPNMNHFAFTETGAIVQIVSHGPFQIIYVNPADDPRNAAAPAGAPAAAPASGGTERGQ